MPISSETLPTIMNIENRKVQLYRICVQMCERTSRIIHVTKLQLENELDRRHFRYSALGDVVNFIRGDYLRGGARSLLVFC
jgi:hypothetical protein